MVELWTNLQLVWYVVQSLLELASVFSEHTLVLQLSVLVHCLSFLVSALHYSDVPSNVLQLSVLGTHLVPDLPL